MPTQMNCKHSIQLIRAKFFIFIYKTLPADLWITFPSSIIVPIKEEFRNSLAKGSNGHLGLEIEKYLWGSHFTKGRAPEEEPSPDGILNSDFTSGFGLAWWVKFWSRIRRLLWNLILEWSASLNSLSFRSPSRLKRTTGGRQWTTEPVFPSTVAGDLGREEEATVVGEDGRREREAARASSICKRKANSWSDSIDLNFEEFTSERKGRFNWRLSATEKVAVQFAGDGEEDEILDV